MKHYLPLALLCIFFACTSEPNPTDQPPQTADSTNIEAPQAEQKIDTASLIAVPINKQTFIKTYTGTIGDGKAIRMRLINWGDGTFSGFYQYTEIGKDLELFGDAQNSAGFILEEYVGDDQTGLFVGRFESASKIKGLWQNANGSKKLPFELEEEVNTYKGKWTGNWHLNGTWDGGILIIGNESASQFDFGLSFVRSGHIGSIEGTATINGNQAQFKKIIFEGEEEPCDVQFDWQTDHIALNQKSSTIACGFGFRAIASGKYEQKEIEQKASLNFGSTEDIFLNQADHDAFKRLVGNDFYALFAFNMQSYGAYDLAQEDPTGIRAIAGAVNGMFGAHEAIIMQDKMGHFWAATIDVEDYENPKLLYFTNTKDKKQLPQTINNWREAFMDYVVEYH